jgi:hypothetical protein
VAAGERTEEAGSRSNRPPASETGAEPELSSKAGSLTPRTGTARPPVNAGGVGRSPRRGRPSGSVKLTADLEDKITAYIQAGVADYIAAETAGIDARTFRDWMARGEGRHPTRKRTPHLVRFATRVREAQAKARASREVVVAERDPKFWLTHMARSKPGREGWTEPVEEPEEALAPATPAYEPSLDEAAEIVRVLLEAGALKIPCPDPNCRCAFHREAHDD